MDSPPAETIEEKMPEENAEETDMLASEEPPAKQALLGRKEELLWM